VANNRANQILSPNEFFRNRVNLSVAGFALYSNLNTDISLLSSAQRMEKHTKSENLFILILFKLFKHNKILKRKREWQQKLHKKKVIHPCRFHKVR